MIWGVDFGTSTSLLSYSTRQAVRTAPLGATNNWIPSLAAVNSDRLLFGEDAENESADTLIRGIKRSITEGNKSHITVGEGSQARDISVDEVILGLLRKVRTIAARTMGDDDVTARFGCPAMWDGVRRERLLELVSKAGFQTQDELLVDEPVAACISWVEGQRTAGENIKGNVLVYDMGGGTLDVAVIHVDTLSGQAPKYFVKSSRGIDTAGEKIDQVIVDFLNLQVCAAKNISPGEATAGEKWLLRPAREMKEALSRRDRIETAFKHPVFGEMTLSLSAVELRQIVQPILDEAWASVMAALRDAELTHYGPGTGVSYYDVFAKLQTGLLERVDYVVLAGGMANMKAVRDDFLDRGIPETKIQIAGGRLGQPNEAITRGLAEDLETQQLNLARPAFHLEIHWNQESTSLDGKVRIYEAYSPLYEQADAGVIPHFRWSRSPEIPNSAAAELKIVDTRTGNSVPFADRNSRETQYVIDFYMHNLKHITLAPNGVLQVVGGNRTPHLRIASWPILKNSDDQAVEVVPVRESEPYLPMWWE